MSARPHLLAAEGLAGAGLVLGRLAHGLSLPTGTSRGPEAAAPVWPRCHASSRLSCSVGRNRSPRPARTQGGDLGSVSQTEGHRSVVGTQQCPQFPPWWESKCVSIRGKIHEVRGLDFRVMNSTASKYFKEKLTVAKKITNQDTAQQTALGPERVCENARLCTGFE